MKTIKTLSEAMKDKKEKPKFWRCGTPALAKSQSKDNNINTDIETAFDDLQQRVNNANNENTVL
jgi:hypothetical protein